MRACSSRVRCGTTPTIRSININWPRWCISCSLTERIISKRLFAAGVVPARIWTRSPRKLSESPSKPTSPFLARAAKHLKGLILAPRFLFFRHQALHQRWKVESLQRSPVLLAVNLVLKGVRQRNMCQQFTDSARVCGWPKTVLFLRKFFGDHNRILPDGAKTLG